MTVYQLNFAGQPEVAGDAVARIRYLLEKYDDARNDYMVLIGRYWLEFDGLGVDEEDFLSWMASRATSPKTIQNRAMEVQSACANLDADPEVRARRKKQARQGPVR